MAFNLNVWPADCSFILTLTTSGSEVQGHR